MYTYFMMPLIPPKVHSIEHIIGEVVVSNRYYAVMPLRYRSLLKSLSTFLQVQRSIPYGDGASLIQYLADYEYGEIVKEEGDNDKVNFMLFVRREVNYN